MRDAGSISKTRPTNFYMVGLGLCTIIVFFYVECLVRTKCTLFELQVVDTKSTSKKR